MANDTTATINKEETKKFVWDAERNGVTVPFFSDKTSRGKNPGVVFTYPEVSEKNLALYISGGKDGYGALGLEVLTSIIATACRRAGQGWTTEACDDDGGFNKEEYLKFFSEWSARGQSIRELQEEAAKLGTEAFDLVNSATSLAPAEQLLVLQKIQKIGLQRKSILEAIAKKKNKNTEEEAIAKEVLSNNS